MSSNTENDSTDKKQELHSKLNDRHQARLKKYELKKQIQDQDAVKEEKSSFFAIKFNEEYNQLTTMLETDNIATTDRTELADYFDSLTNCHQRLQKFYNDSIAFLTSYEARKYQSQLNELKQSIAECRGKMIPKKKFAFKSRTRKNESSKSITTEKTSAVEKYAAKVKSYDDGLKVESKSKEDIILSNEQLEKRDVSLTNLLHCNVKLFGAPGTVHITNCQGSTIVIGPVSGSVFVDKCSECKISTGCQQLRVHNTTHTDFFLHVTSRAIIEDTNNVRFAPYNIEYPDKDEHFKISGLDTATNNWDHVDDFNWLAMSTPSPNWKTIQSEAESTAEQ